MDRAEDREDVKIRPLRRAGDARECASMMARMSPWTVLRLDQKRLLASLQAAGSSTLLAHGPRREILGCITYRIPWMLGGYVALLAVAAGARGRGIGRRLLSEAEKAIFERTPNVFLCVSDFNEPARAFYRACGYEEVGLLSDFMLRGKGEILMRKSAGPLEEYLGRY